LEAEYRERLQRDADRAIYERRTAAVEEERKIRQSELETDIDLEERRKELVVMQAENSLTLAEAEQFPWLFVGACCGRRLSRELSPKV